MKLIEWLKEGMAQKTLDEFEMEIEETEAFKAGIIGQREVWLLTGKYKILKNGFPDVEVDLPDDVKADLVVQRFIATAAARPQFKGIVADKPVTFLRAFEGVYINLGEDGNDWE